MKRSLIVVLLSIVAAIAPSRASAVSSPAVWNVIKASQIPGVVLDCVVNPNQANVGKTASGGTCTDNTAAINSAIGAFAANGAGAIKLILDGGTATTGIVAPSIGYFEIEGIGWNSGIYMIAASNSHAIYNNGKTPPFDQQTTAPARAGYVRLSNFTINGNRGNGTTGNSNSGNPRGNAGNTYWYSNIDLANLNGVRIENMYSYDAPAYNIRLNNCGDIVADSNTLWNPNTTATTNNDDLHIDGPWNDLRVSNNLLYNNFSDDGIALNAPEGYGGAATRTVIVNNTYAGTISAMRVYGSSAGLVGSVLFSNNTGTVGTGIIVGVSVSVPQDAAGQVLTFADNTLTVTGGPFLSLRGAAGDIILSNDVLNAPTTANPFIQGTTSGTASSITVQGCGIYRSTSGNNTSTPLISANAAVTIKRLTISGFRIADELGQSYSAVPNLIVSANLTITSLNVASLDYTNITALADSYANIGSLAGAYANKQVIAANKTGAYTVIQTDAYLRGDATTATFAFTLPAAPYLYEEHEFVKVDSSANAVTIAGNGKTINGNASLASQWSHAKMRYNGTSWDSL